MTTEDPVATYRAARPALDAALDHYLGKIKVLLREGGLPEHYVIGRVKTPRSLIRKLRESPTNPRSWASITDKVGVRVICTTKADCKQAVALIEAGPWSVLGVERKKGNHDRLFYPGIHVEIHDTDLVDHTSAPICCEVQVRTRAQDAWAVASHKLIYKGAITPPKKMRRLVDRLTIFIEVFDDEIHRLYKLRRKIPLYDEALALEHLETAYEICTGQPQEGVKDLSVISQLMSAYSETERKEFSQIIDAFCRDAPQTPQLIAEHSHASPTYQDSQDWLFTQPEVLIVLERAVAKPFLLLDAVTDTDLEDAVRAVCVSAGTPLPSV